VALTGIFFLNLAHAGIAVQHWTHANGARVYLVESPGIPMLDVRVDLDAGSRRDPGGKQGLASAMAGLMTQGLAAQGGRPALDENAMGEAWADLGASFGASASSDRLSFSLRSLTYADILPKAVGLAARVLAEPAFPEAVWQRNRARAIAAINESNTRPATLGNRAFSRAVYGGHPYANEATEASLNAIGVQDMRALHASAVVPCRAVVSLVGAQTRAQADALVQQLFALAKSQPGSAQRADCQPGAAVPEVSPLAAAKEERIAFDSAQAHVFIGQPGFKRDDPDFFALTVGNYILGGGGFVSRLSTEVREKRGLSYSVYSAFQPALHAGAFMVNLQTRPDQAAQAVQVVREVVAQFVAEGPTEAELQAAKDNLMGGFPLLIDSNSKLLGNISNIGWNRLPIDYLDTWSAQVQRVTVADVKAAMQRKLQPGRMVTVVVGGG
jgi:zinc protease